MFSHSKQRVQRAVSIPKLPHGAVQSASQHANTEERFFLFRLYLNFFGSRFFDVQLLSDVMEIFKAGYGIRHANERPAAISVDLENFQLVIFIAPLNADINSNVKKRRLEK